MTKFRKRISMEKQESYGPFQEVASFSQEEDYRVIGKKKLDKDNEIFFFKPKSVNYYGNWESQGIEGNQKEGIIIKENPIYVFVNPDPEDSECSRVEIDFS